MEMNKLGDLTSRKTIGWRKTRHCWAVQQSPGSTRGWGRPRPPGHHPGLTVPVPTVSGTKAFCAHLLPVARAAELEVAALNPQRYRSLTVIKIPAHFMKTRDSQPGEANLSPAPVKDLFRFS